MFGPVSSMLGNRMSALTLEVITTKAAAVNLAVWFLRSSLHSDLGHSRPVGHLAKVYPNSAKETAMTNDHTLDIRGDASIAELTEDQLKKASGGFVSVEHTVVAPRDPASGIATGRRSH
jgi:hypothetical protein